jgi:4-carboxymuconolactone decarboxylase
MSAIPLPENDAITGDDRALLESLPPLNIYRLLMNVPGVITPWITMVGSIYAFSLSDRIREIAILRTVSRAGAAYPTHQHRLLAANNSISEEEISILTSSDPVTSLSPVENLICNAADELESHTIWSNTLREELLHHLGVQQTTELLITVSLYSAVARVANGSNIPIEAESPLKHADTPGPVTKR